MSKKIFFSLLLTIAGTLFISPYTAFAGPIKSSTIRDGGTYDTPLNWSVKWAYDVQYYLPASFTVYFEVDGVNVGINQTVMNRDWMNNPGGTVRHGEGTMNFALNLSPGQHSIAMYGFVTEGFFGVGPFIYQQYIYNPMTVTIRPPIPVPTILVNGIIWGGRVPTTDSPFTLQVTGTNNPTQCFMQTTNALNQTNGYQSFPCDKYITPKSVRPSDFNFTDGVNTFHVYMVNPYGTSKTAVNWATVAPLPEATVLLNGKADDVTVSTPSSPFRLQITGSNNPTHCYMDTGNNSDFEFPCDKYANETTVLPSDFGFADDWNQMRVWMENDNGESDWVIRTVFIHPIPEVTLLLNGASQDIKVPLTKTPFTLQITGTNNPQQCFIKLVNSSGNNDFYRWFDCDEYVTPQKIIPENWPFFFQDGVNTIQVYMENQYGDASDEVANTVSIGTFRPNVSFLLNGLPQDLVLATATSPFDMYVSWDNNPTSCYESRKSPLAPVWGPYNKLPDQICTVEGVIEGVGVSPSTFGLQTGVNGIRYYVSNSAGNSDVVTRFITVPPPATKTLTVTKNTEKGPGAFSSITDGTTELPAATLNGINCGGGNTCMGIESGIASGSKRVITASTASSDVVWSGCDNALANPCIINSINVDKSVTATFTLRPIDGTCGGSNGGSFPNLTTASAGLCGVGTIDIASFNLSGTSYSWRCDGTGVGANQSPPCSATQLRDYNWKEASP